MDSLSSSNLCSLIRITAAVALRDETSLTQELKDTLAAGISVSIIRETILQTYLFAGYASAINAFIVLNSLIPADSSFFKEEEGSIDLWQVRGMDLCRKIYGSQFARLVENMKQLHPDLADWMIWEGYGKVLSRPFLSPRIRELLIVGMTGVLGVDRQFHSHVRGALHVGADPSEILLVYEQIAPLLEESVRIRLQRILEDLLPAK